MVFSSTIFVTLLSQVFASLAIVWKFIAVDFEASMDALYVVGGWMILLNHQIVAIFAELSSIYKRKSADDKIEQKPKKMKT